MPSAAWRAQFQRGSLRHLAYRRTVGRLTETNARRNPDTMLVRTNGFDGQQISWHRSSAGRIVKLLTREIRTVSSPDRCYVKSKSILVHPVARVAAVTIVAIIACRKSRIALLRGPPKRYRLKNAPQVSGDSPDPAGRMGRRRKIKENHPRKSAETRPSSLAVSQTNPPKPPAIERLGQNVIDRKS